MAAPNRKPGDVAELTPPDERPSRFRIIKAFFEADQLGKMDREIIRRKAQGEDRDDDGHRININRSTLLRELVDGATWPL